MASIKRRNQRHGERPYPPISSIPPTPDSRLRAPPTTAKSVLYLAFGSNLCAETLLGVRGVRPISKVNVSAPALDLSFDLPGFPYIEPCFANVTPRKVPGLPDPSKPPEIPPITTPVTKAQSQDAIHDPIEEKDSGIESAATQPQRNGWTQGLFGVVYELTHEDYATVIATEGPTYMDVVVPCFPVAPRMSLPEKPPIKVPKPFFAHTLYAPPAIPDAPDGGSIGMGACDDDKKPGNPDDPRRKKWYWRFLQSPVRPDPTYAQPSARYLNLIRDGAREHELPDDYQKYLGTLQPYRATNWKQVAAGVLIKFTFGPIMLFSILLGKRLADKNGRPPLWLVIFMGMAVNSLWAVYDCIMKPIFGDGERTQEESGSGTYTRSTWAQVRRQRLLTGDGREEEQMPLYTDEKV